MPQNAKPLRPEDRRGIQVGTRLSKTAVFIFRSFVRLIRKTPMFRGKVRLVSIVRRRLGLENHHIIETIQLHKPLNYQATLDLHSWHEYVAYIIGGYEPDTVDFLVQCYDEKGAFLDLGANIGLLSLPFALIKQRSAQKNAPHLRYRRGRGTA